MILSMALALAWLVFAATLAIRMIGPQSRRRQDRRQNSSRDVLAHLQERHEPSHSRR